jgi:hypothetical protein
VWTVRESRVDNLDRILSSEEPLTPSSGFTARVMEAIQDAALEPPPLPFPWTRFMVGIGVCIAWAAAGVVFLSRVDLSGLGVALAPVGPELAYGAAAAIVSVMALRVQRVLRARSGLPFGGRA